MVSKLTQSSESLTLEAARLIAAAVEAKSRQIGVPMNIAIVDAHTHLLHFNRMEGAKVTSIAIAIDKAFTAAGHKVPTHMYKDAVWPGGPAFGINWSNGGRFQTIGGGLPIKDAAGNVVGAVGCSTGTPAQDLECSTAGLEAFNRAAGLGAVKAKL
ncbi:hypothetical protein PYCC9005_001235 [Savitreella phatthalungensis]